VTYDRLVVFYGSSGFLHHFPDHHEIIDILLKVASNTIKHHNPITIIDHKILRESK